MKKLVLTIVFLLCSTSVLAQGRTTIDGNNPQLPDNLGTNGGIKVECWTGAAFGACSSGGAGTDVNIAAVAGTPIVGANVPVNCVVGCAGGTTDTDDGSVAAGQVTSIPATLNYIYNGATWGRLTFGNTTMANSIPVTIASNQTAIPISAASLPLPTGASTLAEQQTQTTALQLIDNIVSGAGANITQFGGTNVVTGTGAGGAGIPRVTISNDSSLAANQSVNVAQFGGNATATGIGGAGNGVPRVTTSSDDLSGSVSFSSGTACGAATANTVVTSAGCIIIPLAGYTGAAIEIQTGTLAATVVYEYSMDGGTTWTAAFVNINATNVVLSVFTNPNALTDANFILGPGWSHIRARVSAFTSGAATAVARATKLVSGLAIGSLSAGFIGAGTPSFVNMSGLKAQTGVPTAATNATVVNQNGDVYGVPFVRQDHPNRIRCFSGLSTATILTVITGCGAPGAGLSIYITDVEFSTNVSGITADIYPTLKYGTGGACGTGTVTFWGQFTTAAAQENANSHYITPVKVPANNEVCWILTTAGSKIVSVNGYIAP